MRPRLTMLAAGVLVVLVAIFFNNIPRGNTGTTRYHQHLEQPSADVLLPCTQNHEGLCTHLPILRIETGGQKIPGAASILRIDGKPVLQYEKGNHGEDEILATVSTVEKIGVWHHEDDISSLESKAYVRYRGDSSRHFSKPSYRIKLVDENDTTLNNNLPLLGMAKESDWALHGPFLDKTLIRNYMWMNISAEVMGYAPNVRFCELIVDGEYKGLYVLMETIKVDTARVSLSKYQTGDPVSSYLIEITSAPDTELIINNFTKYTERMENPRSIEILYPNRRLISPQVKNIVETDFNEIERILYSSKMVDGSELWSERIDLNSAVNFYILQEFLMINDVFSKSTYFHKDVRGKLHMGPVWDYNNALNNFFLPLDEGDFIVAHNGWFEVLLSSKAFVNKTLLRYHELRKGVLSEEYLLQYVDETLRWLGPAIQRNFEVWGYSFDVRNLKIDEMRLSSNFNDLFATAAPNDFEALNRQRMEEALVMNPKSHEEAVQWMKDTIVYRGRWLDRNIHCLRQYCADSKLHAKMVE